MNNNFVTFRLTTGKKEGTWVLPKGTAEKDGDLKYIDYFKGSHSYFEEDNAKTIFEREAVVFEYNDILNDPACEIQVPKSNKVLINYLRVHPYNGIHYAEHNPEQIAEEKSKNLDKVGEAFEILSKETSDIRVQAMAVAILGAEFASKTLAECSAALKEIAIKNPDKILEKNNNETNFEAKFLSALAFQANVVKEGEGGTSVIWNDENRGVIIRLAQGQRGLDKLAELFTQSDDESRNLLQAISEKANVVTKAEVFSVQEAQILKEDNAKKDQVLEDYKAKNAEMEAELAELRAFKEAQKSTNSTQNNFMQSTTSEDTENVKLDDLTLEEIQKAYVEMFKKDLPPAQKNNKEWILGKLKEA